MKKIVLIGTAAALAIVAGGALGADKTVPLVKGTQFTTARFTIPSNVKTLYDQNDYDGNWSFDSQKFGGVDSKYTDQAADDFVVPTGKIWTVMEIDVTGRYDGLYGPAKYENVYFYDNKGTLPGRLIAKALRVKGADNGQGSFAIVLPAAVSLGAGAYWVSVQAYCSGYNSCGEWAWEDRHLQRHNPAVWRNPHGGWGIGCQTWNTTQNCLGLGPDLMFALKGRGS